MIIVVAPAASSTVVGSTSAVDEKTPARRDSSGVSAADTVSTIEVNHVVAEKASRSAAMALCAMVIPTTLVAFIFGMVPRQP